jgi:predicted dehydrogenase
MASKIGVGFLGLSAAGRWAATAHVPALRALPEFELRALAASTPESAAAAVARFGVPFHTHSADELAARADVDLVVVAVRLPRHLELVTAALRAGKMVYCEWPLGTDLAEARQMAALARARGVRTFVGLQGRAAPAVHYLRELVQQGFVGEVLSTTVIGSLGRPWAGDVDETSTYLLDVRRGASMLSIPFAHTVDAIGTVLGRFTEASATIAVRRPQVTVMETGRPVPMTAPDQVAVSGRLESGAVASIHYRAVGTRCTGFHWEINGTAGDLLIRGENGHMQYGRIQISGARGPQAELAPMPVPDSYQRVDLPRNDLSYTVAHAYRAVLDDIRTGSHTVPDFHDVLPLHALVDGLAKAGCTGVRERFDWTVAS